MAQDSGQAWNEVSGDRLYHSAYTQKIAKGSSNDTWHSLHDLAPFALGSHQAIQSYDFPECTDADQGRRWPASTSTRCMYSFNEQYHAHLHASAQVSSKFLNESVWVSNETSSITPSSITGTRRRRPRVKIPLQLNLHPTRLKGKADTQGA